MSTHYEFLNARNTRVEYGALADEGPFGPKNPVLALSEDDVVAISGTPEELARLALRMLTKLPNNPLRTAAIGLIESDDALSHLTCGEIQGFIDLLVQARMTTAAVAVILNHASHDDDAYDAHSAIYDALNADDYEAGRDRAEDLAHQMVEDLLNGHPAQKWRLILPGGEIYDHQTKESRDAAAPELAKARMGDVKLMRWEPENGWVADGIVYQPERES